MKLPMLPTLMKPLCWMQIGIIAFALPAAAQVMTIDRPGSVTGPFGESIAISGTRLIIGASQDQTFGKAYVYDLSGASPTIPVATLNNPSPAANDLFGWSVAISGSRVVVGAHFDDTGAIEAGSAYIYDLSSPTPTVPVSTVNNPSPAYYDRFGYSVAIDGTTVAMSALSNVGVHVFATNTAEIALDLGPAHSDILDGGTQSFGNVFLSAVTSLTFNIKNIGIANLTGLGITIDGTDASDFTLTTSPTAPVSGPTGTTTFTVRFAPTSLGAKTAALHVANNDPDENPFDIILSGTGINNAPTISNITDTSISEDAVTNAIAFIVGDVETAAADLTVSGNSSNTALVPNSNIVFGGTGASRAVTVTPLANQFGTATITVTVSDGMASASDTFLLTVNSMNDAPTISDITDQTINEDTNTGALSFNLGDVETAATSLTVTRASSNTVLVPTANIVFGGSGANRNVTVTPAANQFGTATITVTVSDGAASTSDTFLLTVDPVNDAPVITGQQALSTPEETGLTIVAANLTVTDPDNPYPTGFTLSVQNGSNYSRTGNTITPALNFTGTLTVPVLVNDGTDNSNTFNLSVTVTPVNDAPTISDISDTLTNEDTSTPALPLTIGDVETAVSSLTLSRASNNTALVPLSGIVFGGSGASRSVTVTPAANQFGTATITVTVSDGTASASDTFLLTVDPVNDAPTMTDITDQAINEDANTGARAFTIGDVETAAASLTVSGTSTNTALVPDLSIVFGGSGTNRTVTVTPLANQFGTTIIAITVGDGVATTSDTFLLTVNSVNDVPTISDITDQTINEDGTTAALPFTIGDVETAATSLTMTGASTNTALVPNANIVFSGSGANRSVAVTPAANQFGTATITITVSDGTGSTNDTFLLTVTSVNDVPTISDITDQTINEDTNTGALSFTIGDVETAATSLTVSRTSSNTVLVPTANVVLAGSGASRSVTVTPAA